METRCFDRGRSEGAPLARLTVGATRRSRPCAARSPAGPTTCAPHKGRPASAASGRVAPLRLHGWVPPQRRLLQLASRLLDRHIAELARPFVTSAEHPHARLREVY